VIPRFDPVDFLSFYVELPLMAVMGLGWLALRGRRRASSRPRTGVVEEAGEDEPLVGAAKDRLAPWWRGDLVDIQAVDLRRDEYEEGSGEDQAAREEEEERAKRVSGRMGWAWKVWYAVV
jgi:AAT family amino acid transporter